MTSNYTQTVFDRLISDHDDEITVTTATALAKELGVTFDPADFDLP